MSFFKEEIWHHPDPQQEEDQAVDHTADQHGEEKILLGLMENPHPVVGAQGEDNEYTTAQEYPGPEFPSGQPDPRGFQPIQP